MHLVILLSITCYAQFSLIFVNFSIYQHSDTQETSEALYSSLDCQAIIANCFRKCHDIAVLLEFLFRGMTENYTVESTSLAPRSLSILVRQLFMTKYDNPILNKYKLVFLQHFKPKLYI